MSSWFSFVIGDILLGDYFLWDKHVVFQTSCFALHFKVVPAIMNKLTLHMPSKEEGLKTEFGVLCCSLDCGLLMWDWPLPGPSFGVTSANVTCGFVCQLVPGGPLWLSGLHCNSRLATGLAVTSIAPALVVNNSALDIRSTLPLLPTF